MVVQCNSVCLRMIVFYMVIKLVSISNGLYVVGVKMLCDNTACLDGRLMMVVKREMVVMQFLRYKWCFKWLLIWF